MSKLGWFLGMILFLSSLPAKGEGISDKDGKSVLVGDTIVCPDCNGIGNSVCEACNGERQVPREFDCGECHGSGTVDCPGCDGGWTPCLNEGCQKGWVTGGCPDCWGKSAAEVAACRRCQGTGRVTVQCMYCKGAGTVPHDYCRGRGELTCGECQGRKTVTRYTMCLVCEGKGFHKCYTCHGQGWIIED